MIKDINERINKEYCDETYMKLSDSNLKNHYMKSKSYINKVKRLEYILDKNKIDKIVIDKIVEEYSEDLISPGLKGNIRGQEFNTIIKNHILDLKLDDTRYNIYFEKELPISDMISEKPDWFIIDNKTNKLIIGMNQLDLWNGGQQTNRADKYINFYNDKYKLLCVVCNHIEVKQNKTKIYKIFNKGFINNSICYIKNLENIINSYFNK